MKRLMTLSLSLFASASFACTDFTGSYKSAAETTYSISQTACSDITLSTNAGSVNILGDGQYRVVEETPETKSSMAASFIDDTFTMTTLIEYKVEFPPGTPMEQITKKMTMVLTKNASGDMVTDITAYNKAGEVLMTLTLLDQRI